MSKYITDEELKKSLRHYWRMRFWAKHQPPDDYPAMAEMISHIYEGWYSNDCFLCEKYNIKVFKDLPSSCKGCPLFENDFPCTFGSVWHSLAISLSWEVWIHRATAMAELIISLPREKK
jgi:hypothetical protein